MAQENNASQVSRVNAQRATIEKLWFEPEFANQQGTTWSLVNAVSNYEQWQSHLRGETTRDERIAIKTVGIFKPINTKSLELSEGIMKYFRPIDKFIRSNHLIEKNAHTRGLAKDLLPVVLAGLSVKETQNMAEARAKIIYLFGEMKAKLKDVTKVNH